MQRGAHLSARVLELRNMTQVYADGSPWELAQRGDGKPPASPGRHSWAEVGSGHEPAPEHRDPARRPLARGRPRQVAEGRGARLPRCLHLRPPVLAHLPRRPVVRSSTHPHRRRHRDRAASPGHPRHLAEFPASGHARQGADLARRHLGRPDHARHRSRRQRLRRDRPGAGAVDAEGAGGPVRGVRAAARPAAHRGRRERAGHALLRRRGPQHPGLRPAPPAPFRRRRNRPARPEACRAARAGVGDHG